MIYSYFKRKFSYKKRENQVRNIIEVKDLQERLHNKKGLAIKTKPFYFIGNSITKLHPFKGPSLK